MKSRARALTPDFCFELTFDGPVCGLDEAGRGPLAGPVVAACVYIPAEKYTLGFVSHVRDSKTLSAQKREDLYDAITSHCVWGVAEILPDEIDRLNILQASLKAMRLAMECTQMNFVHALVDGNRLPKLSVPATAIVKGDARSVSIAAASIVAKVTRDRLMRKLHIDYPAYGWDSNAGYGTKSHLDAIKMVGLSPHHRKTFAPVRNYELFGKTESLREIQPVES